MSALSPSLLDLACLRLGTRAWNTQARRSISSGAASARRNMHDYAPSSASGSSSSDHGHEPAFDQKASYPAGGSNGPRNYKRSTLGALSVRPQPSTSKQVLPENQHTQLHMQEHTDIMDELQQRIDKLQKLNLKEDADSLDAHINADTAAFSEDELMNFYQDVLALPEENVPGVSAPDAVSEHENDLELVQGLHQRLLGPVLSSESAPSTSTMEVDTTASSPSLSSHATILAHIRDNLSAETQIQETESHGAVKTLGISFSEWEALARIAASEQDGLSTVETLRLMIHSGFEPSEPLLNVCMNVFARTGDVPATEAFMQRFLTDTPTDTQRDMHVKAHLRSVPRGTTPRSALALLHSYEAGALPAPIKTYSRAIGALFAVRPPDTTSAPGSTQAELESPRQAHAQAWDLFVHMRYAAHPTPDLMLYTQMLRACALPASGRTSVFSPLGTAEPERALDLWHEMTVEQGLAPNMLAYEAVISACARSGEERYVDEAFRLAKECLDGERDAHGRTRFSATPSLCRALLDGAKRVGALGRARWILAEMIRVARTSKGQEEGEKREVVVDEQTMMHVFHAYSSYVPPFKRTLAKIVDGEEVPVVQAVEGELDPQDLVREALSPQPSLSEETSELSEGHGSDKGHAASVSRPNSSQAPNEINLIHGPQFPTHVPQSHAEVLAEASFLFARILAAQGSPASSSASTPDSSAAPENALDTSDFSDVRLSPRLVNAFLSVFYAHGSTEVCRVLWRDIWAQVASLGPGPSAPVSTCDVNPSTGPTPRVFLPLAPIARSYVEALERCSNSERGHDREVAFAWAQEMWPAWVREESAWRAGRPTLPGLDYRMIERAHTAMIRMLAVNEQLDKALTHLRGFVAAYPPRAVRKTPPKDEMRSTRTLLIGPNPLVRLTSPVHVADDRVPPILTFGDLEIVHHRLQAVGDAKAVGYVHWVCKAYEGELRRRREKMLLSEGRKGKSGIVTAS